MYQIITDISHVNKALSILQTVKVVRITLREKM